MADFYSGWVTPPNGFAKIRIWLSVTVASQDTLANTSILNWATYLQKDRSQTGFYGYTASGWGTSINGTSVLSGAGKQPSAPWDRWETWTLGNGQITVAHDTDGTKNSMPVSAYYDGANTAWAPGSMSLSGTMSLPSIARATTPTVTPSPATVGSTVTIDLPRKVGTYTHTVTWVCGTQSGTIGTGLGVSTTWTVPNILSEYPGRPTAPIIITAETFSGATSLGTRQVTLFARAAPAAPSVTPRTPAEQFDIRARLVEYVGGKWITTREVPASTIQMVDSLSATATCTLTVSKLNAVDFPDYSIVDIDVYNGKDWIFTNHRFVLSRVVGDEIDPSKTFSYTGTEYVDYVLGFGYTQRDYEWDNWTPGSFIGDLITDGWARGWGPRITFDFDSEKTSYDEPWRNREARKTSKGTPFSQALSGIVDDGLAEYRTEYRNDKGFLVLLNPGTGMDFSAVGSNPVVNLSLAALTRAPRRSTVEKRLTRVTVTGDTVEKDQLQVTREKAPFDSNVFGHMEGWVSASGVDKAAAAGTIGDNALRDNSTATSERTFEFAPRDNGPQYYPYFVYTPGDWVLIPDGDNAVKDRISQVTVAKNVDGDISMTVLTGDRIMSGTASLAKRQSAQSGGSISGGNQTTPAPLDSRIPDEPIVTSATSAGYWNSDGAAKSAITLTWGPVTAGLDGTALQCDLYEIWWRPAGLGTEWSFRTSTNLLTVTMPGWDVLQNVELRVRAKSVAGIFGQFSVDESHTTLAPPVDLDGPVIADLYTDGVGSIYIVWAGILGITTAPARLAYVTAEVSTDAGATYSTMGTSLAGPGQIILNMGTAWGDYTVRIRGYDRLGNAGDPSAPQTITLTDPGLNPAIPKTPVNLGVTAGAAWDAEGAWPTAWFDLTWDAVTLDLDGNPITVVGYDVWGRQSLLTEPDIRFITSSQTNSAHIHAADAETWSFQVKAISNFGGTSSLSSSITATADAVVSSPPAPDAPTLDQYAGLLRVIWAGGGLVPQIKYVFASISTTLGGTYTRAGMPLQGPGELVIPGLATGETYYAKINLVDKRGNVSVSAASAPLLLHPITGITIQTSPVANTGIKMTDSSLTSYDVSGNPTFILDAITGNVWIAPYDSVFYLGAPGYEAEYPNAATTGISIASDNSNFNTFIHPKGTQIRNNETPLSWWEGDSSDANLINFFSPRAVFSKRMLVGDYEMVPEAKTTGTRLVIRYKGA